MIAVTRRGVLESPDGVSHRDTGSIIIKRLHRMVRHGFSAMPQPSAPTSRLPRSSRRANHYARS
jgi:hypothetical protein